MNDYLLLTNGPMCPPLIRNMIVSQTYVWYHSVCFLTLGIVWNRLEVCTLQFSPIFRQFWSFSKKRDFTFLDKSRFVLEISLKFQMQNLRLFMFYPPSEHSVVIRSEKIILFWARSVRGRHFFDIFFRQNGFSQKLSEIFPKFFIYFFPWERHFKSFQTTWYPRVIV